LMLRTRAERTGWLSDIVCSLPLCSIL
jgi:hypothetical protein